MTETNGDTELRTLLGMRGRGGWVFLAGLTTALGLHMTPPFLSAQVPVIQAALACVLMVGAGAILVLASGDPLPWPATAAVCAAGPCAVALTHFGVADGVRPQPWAVFASSFLLGVLVLRGRIGSAWAGAGAVAVVVSAAIAQGTMGGTADSLTVLIITLSTPVGTSICVLILRPTQRSLRLLRSEAARRAAVEAAMAAQYSERVRQLARLDAVARPMLERIARGVELTPAEREECRLLEAGLRDYLRAPQLSTDQLSSAARRARSRGVEVLLFDDGGFAEAPAGLREQVVRLAIDELDGAEGGSVTVRVLPPGRRNLATLLSTAAGGDRRTEVTASGAVSVSV